jgi:hypothetical protein
VKRSSVHSHRPIHSPPSRSRGARRGSTALSGSPVCRHSLARREISTTALDSVKRSGKNLSERAFAILSDPTYFPGLWALLNSIYAYHDEEVRVFVFGYGLALDHLRRLRCHPIPIEYVSTDKFPFRPAGAWEAKQQIMSYLIPKARCVYLLPGEWGQLLTLDRSDSV